MRIAGHKLSEHLSLLAPLFALVGTVWLLRLLTHALDCPPWFIRLFSVTVTCSVAILLAVVLIHLRRFGGFPSVVLASFLLSAWTHLLIALAIASSILTGFENVYTRPQHSSLMHLRHLVGHLTFDVGLGTLVGSLMGAILLWVLRKTLR